MVPQDIKQIAVEYIREYEKETKNSLDPSSEDQLLVIKRLINEFLLALGSVRRSREIQSYGVNPDSVNEIVKALRG